MTELYNEMTELTTTVMQLRKDTKENYKGLMGLIAEIHMVAEWVKWLHNVWAASLMTDFD